MNDVSQRRKREKEMKIDEGVKESSEYRCNAQRPYICIRIYKRVLNTIKKFYTKVYLCISKMPKTL